MTFQEETTFFLLFRAKKRKEKFPLGLSLLLTDLSLYCVVKEFCCANPYYCLVLALKTVDFLYQSHKKGTFFPSLSPSFHKFALQAVLVVAHKVVEAHIRPVLVVLCLLVDGGRKKNDVYQTVYFLPHSLFISRRTPHTS